MVRYLDKEKELELLPELFDLLYENMHSIAPFSESYEGEKGQWVHCIKDALKREPRRMLLLYAGNTLAGFCMYYINDGKLMVEEVQIRKEYRHTTVAAELFQFLKHILTPDVAYIEAFADKRNLNSRHLMEKRHMKPIGQTPDGTCIHYRGERESFLTKKEP